MAGRLYKKGYELLDKESVGVVGWKSKEEEKHEQRHLTLSFFLLLEGQEMFCFFLPLVHGIRRFILIFDCSRFMLGFYGMWILSPYLSLLVIYLRAPDFHLCTYTHFPLDNVESYPLALVIKELFQPMGGFNITKRYF